MIKKLDNGTKANVVWVVLHMPNYELCSVYDTQRLANVTFKKFEKSRPGEYKVMDMIVHGTVQP